MKKLLFAIAGAASFAALAADPEARSGDISLVGFENYTVDQTVIGYDDGGGSGSTLWSASGDDASLVKTYGGDNATAPSITEPAPFAGETNTKYLALDTNGSELQRAIPAAGQAIAADGTYIDTLVQFTPSESDPTSADLTGAKLAIWLKADSEHNTTNLMVQAGIVAADGTVSSHAYKLNASAEPNTWYRLTVTALKNITKVPAENMAADGFLNGFQIKLDGTLLEAATDTAFAEDYFTQTLLDPDWGWLNAETDAATITLLRSNTLFPSLAGVGSDDTLTAVGFKGTGALDDFVVTTEAPDFTPAAIDFSLTWPAGLTAVSYQIGENAPVAISGNSPFAVPGLAAGDVVKFIVANADGAQKTLTGTAGTDAGLDATGTTFGWPEYLGEAVAGAYEIDNLAELILFQKGVAAGLTTASTTFKLTDDVTLTAPWEGVGLKNAKDTLVGDSKATPPIAADMAAFVAGAFNGVFDGQNHTISGFQMVGVAGNPKNNNEGLDYCGFFNAVAGATICNLKIQYAGALFAEDTTASTKESGATFVGVTTNSTLQNLTALQKDAATAVSCSKGFGGIVGYLSAGTTVEYCTNNVNMTSLANNKCGGIAMITQGGSGQATIRNCQNNGTQTTGSSNSEYGAIVGYVGVNTTIADCETTVGRFLKHQGNTVTLQGVNKGDPTVPAYHGAATPGLNFATVDGSVATFVADTAMTTGNTYKVLGPSATATYEFAAAGSISFDTNLIQTVTFAITAAQGLDAPTETTENGVVTFTVAAQGGDDYVVTIDGSDVVVTPSAEDLAAVQAAVVAGGGTLDVTDVAAVNAAMAAPIGTTGVPSWQALFLGLPPTEAGLESFKIDSISIGADGNVTVALPASVDPKTGRGVTITLKLKAADTPNAAPADWTDVESASGTTFAPFAPGSTDTKKFYKVVVEFAGSQN